MSNETEGAKLVHWKYSYVKEPLILTGFILLIALLKLLYHAKKKFSELIPESCLLILLGIFLGKLFSLDPDNASHDFLVFHYRTFFLFILPPIILETSYSLRDAAFMGNISTILLYACAGTILNIVLVGFGLLGLSHVGCFPGLEIRWVDCFIFASLIASVDPVAVLAIFQQVGVNKVLYFLVLGESIFNDAVTIVIYNSMLEFTDANAISTKTVLISVGAFFTDSLGAFIIGLSCGIITALLTKYSRKVQTAEPIFVLGMAYMSYILAEMFGFSGIISIIVCGLNQAHYAMNNVSKESATTVVYFSKAASSAMEALIFIILGVMIVNNTHFWGKWNTSFSIYALLLVIVSRFIAVFSLTLFANLLMEGLRHITVGEQLIMAYGGLRGAVSFSLVIMLSPHMVPLKDTLLATTFLVILFTVFFQGTTIKPLVKLLSVSLRHKKTVMIAEVTNSIIGDIMWGIEELIDYEKKGRFSTVCSDIMHRCLIRTKKEVSKRASHGHKLLRSLHKMREEDYYAMEEGSPDRPDAPDRPADDRTRLIPSQPNLSAALSNPLYRAMLVGCHNRDLTEEDARDEALPTLREQDLRLRRVFGGHVPEWTPRPSPPSKSTPGPKRGVASSSQRDGSEGSVSSDEGKVEKRP